MGNVPDPTTLPLDEIESIAGRSNVTAFGACSLCSSSHERIERRRTRSRRGLWRSLRRRLGCGLRRWSGLGSRRGPRRRFLHRLHEIDQPLPNLLRRLVEMNHRVAEPSGRENEDQQQKPSESPTPASLWRLRRRGIARHGTVLFGRLWLCRRLRCFSMRNRHGHYRHGERLLANGNRRHAPTVRQRFLGSECNADN